MNRYKNCGKRTLYQYCCDEEAFSQDNIDKLLATGDAQQHITFAGLRLRGHGEWSHDLRYDTKRYIGRLGQYPRMSFDEARFWCEMIKQEIKLNLFN